MSGTCIQNFFQGGDTKFRHFFKRSFFPAELILSNFSSKNDFRAVLEHAPPKIFLKFAHCNGHFSAFRTIFRQSLFKFLVPNFECFAKCDAFCRHSFDYACLRRLSLTVMKRFEVMEKFYSSKALFKMHFPHPPPWIRHCL